MYEKKFINEKNNVNKNVDDNYKSTYDQKNYCVSLDNNKNKFIVTKNNWKYRTFSILYYKYFLLSLIIT